MNLVRRLVLTKEVFGTLDGFDGKLVKEEANSKKLSEELKAMSLEKAQLESEKKFLQVRLDTLANKADELKAKHEVELAASKECLKNARIYKRATEVAQNSLETLAAEKERLLAERLKVDLAEAEAKAVAAYHEGFGDTPEYQDLAHHFMTSEWRAASRKDRWGSS
ncbi:hypothetical protein Adt_23246 [Abeliophyllum distichum]|uniref:Uncharacterized protein n=1 Tax=Abeliophyllum distichum TaxID=126358 RepID=A0ABD1SAL9_9LAMI